MSFLSRLLGRTFSTSTQPSAGSTTTPAAAVYTPGFMKSLYRDIFKERSLKRLVKKFKNSSEIYRFRTNASIYKDTVGRLAAKKCNRYIEEILEDQKKYKDISKEGFNARLIFLYGRAGMFENAHKVFDEMPERNCKRSVLSFNALLTACASSKKFDQVDGLFRELPGKLEIEPDLISYNTVIKAFCEMGSLDSGISLLAEMKKKGLEPDLITFNTLLHWFYANGRFVDGEKIWGQMVEKNVSPDIRSYNAKLLGLALEKRTKDAVELVEKMRSKGINPDTNSFNSLIKGFVTEGNLQEAKRWYDKITKEGCKPDKLTFETLIPLVCQRGDFGYGFELSKDLIGRKCAVDKELLQRLLDGLHKESKISEAEELVQLGRKNGYYRYKLKLPSDGSY